METPRLRITPEAKSALERLLATSSLGEPRAAVMWASGGVRSYVDAFGKTHAESLGPAGWCVAIYDGVSLAQGQKYELSGVPLCVVQPSFTQRLSGATLQWLNGKFVVEERAI